MSLRGAVGLRTALLALLMLAACTRTPVPAETSFALCANGWDDDGDELDDCRDPDCWGHEVCRQKRGGGPLAPAPIDDEVSIADPPLVDDNMQEPPAMGLPDAGMPPEPTDAGVPIEPPDAGVPPPVCVGCEGECIDGVCVETTPVLGRFLVRSLEVEVASSHRMQGRACYDENDECGEVLPVPCACRPDPQVAIWVDGVKAGFVEQQEDSEMATWDEPAIELALNVGSLIEIEVADHDVDDTGHARFETMLVCILTADSALVASGELGCDESIDLPLVQVPRRVTAYIERLDAATAE
jgi:hypothetical protein